MFLNVLKNLSISLVSFISLHVFCILLVNVPSSFLAYSCDPNDFRCQDGLCVNKSLLCDGVKHCADGEDELQDNCHRGNGKITC